MYEAGLKGVKEMERKALNSKHGRKQSLPVHLTRLTHKTEFPQVAFTGRSSSLKKL
jgi:hypothetical protein